MTTQLTKTAGAALLALTLWNCTTTDPEPTPYGPGVYVLNEGNFSDNNGSISYLPYNANKVATDIFKTANPERTLGLGGGVAGYTEIDGKGVILVDNSSAGQDKIEIVDIGTFKSLITIKAPDVENPRRVVKAGPNKAYVTCWDATGTYPNTFVKPGYVLVLDLASRTVVKKIPVQKAAERMVVVGNELFVGSASYGVENTLTIIDLTTDAVKQQIDFGSIPQPIAVDATGKLWILSGKDMVKFNPQSRAVETRLTFVTSPSSVVLGPDKNTFYYTASKATYRFLSTDLTVKTPVPFISRSFTGLGIDPQTGTIYAGVTPSYKQAGYVVRYKSDTGAVIDSVQAEIAPSGFFFR